MKIAPFFMAANVDEALIRSRSLLIDSRCSLSTTSYRQKIFLNEAFAREMILVPGKAKKRAKRELTVVNDRLSTFLTQHGSKMALVQRSLNIT